MDNIKTGSPDAVFGKEAEALNLTAAQVEQRLSRLMASPGGLQKVAAQMLSPLVRDLLFEGHIRQLFETYKLAQGEEAVFDADVDAPAAAIGVNGLPAQQVVYADRIRVETSPIASHQEVRWNESNFRKYDVLNRTQERAKASIMFQEDSKGYTLINYAAGLTGQTASTSLGTTTAANNNPSLLTDTGLLSMSKLVEAIQTVKSKQVPPSKIWLHPIRSKDIMLFNQTPSGNGGAGIFAPNMQEQAMKAGKAGSIWGLDVLESILVPTSQVFILPQAKYLGVLAIRSDVAVETMKDVNKMADIFAVWQDVGFVIRWVKGICRITIS